MQKTVVINVVGLSQSVIGEHTPFLKEYIKKKHLNRIKPVLPALTTSTQSTYLTGKWPEEHGIVANGWYDREENDIKFWKQSNKMVLQEKIWERAKALDPNFTCSQMFWWYNMNTQADYIATPRPNYLADGRKIPDCYTKPSELRDELHEELGQFPLFHFWGPGADIKSSKWIADASIIVDKKHDPTLTLIYLPHLDYCQQKFGPDTSVIKKELNEIDELIKQLVTHYEQKDTKIIILSEYGIAPVNNPIHINRIFRKEGLLNIRIERGLELLDPAESKAFSVSDHQIAHIYINDKSKEERIKEILKNTPGVELVLDREEQSKYRIGHERAGDLVVMADKNSWFTYYFWLDDAKAPDYARVVDIHKKPGYDPVEMFMTSKARAAYVLMKKKLGFRYIMNVIPLDATLVKGSHGSVAVDKEYYPVIITDEDLATDVSPVDVYGIMWDALNPA
ncbi:MAG TPA: alkaline phosphatase family protein [Sphingobacteriaceae bacterium]|nr:alkaline phosphatase family protein [Sphingobacteriaceae bacterium]